MKTSPIWTATYRDINGNCYSVTWGSEFGPKISRNTALNLANGFLKAHSKPTLEVPALYQITYLYPYNHKGINAAYVAGQAWYHIRPNGNYKQ